MTNSEGWLVLPDRAGARQVVTSAGSGTVLAHASGRPWLVGSLDRNELTLASAGSLRVAVIGSCSLTATRLTELVRRVRSVAELDALAGVLPGCWHLVASVEGVVRVQGSLAGLRRVFHTHLQGIPIAAGRADVLARLAGGGIDEQALAVRVACGPKVAPPVGERSLWRGVRALPPDHYLRIDPVGRVGERRWWHPPTPERSLGAGASAVREALETAVAARRPTHGRLSTDLSGGIDSTSLCFLAARTRMPRLLSFRQAEADAANDDAIFAAHAARHLTQAEHLVLPQADAPAIFADPHDVGDPEAPYCYPRTLARARHAAALLASHGSGMHLAGHGGDELFHHSSLAYLHSLLRHRPLTAITHLRGYRALRGWSWATTISALARGEDLGAWWRQQAHQLATRPLPRRTPPLGWGHPLRAPAWVTPAALDTARAVLREAGETAQPLAADRGQHTSLAILRTQGPHYRQLRRIYASAGLRLELPYFDDRVIEAALAVRTHERRTPWRYKPVLVEAMRPILPEVIAARTSKGEFGADSRAGLRRHLPEILDLFADSALATQGLINPDLLRRELLAPQIDNTVRHALENLLGCETWLRTTHSPGGPHTAAASPISAPDAALGTQRT